MESLHQAKIAKRAFSRLWDTLSVRDQSLIVNDVEHTSELGKWFYHTVALEVKAKYESATYWMNEPESFKHGQYCD